MEIRLEGKISRVDWKCSRTLAVSFYPQEKMFVYGTNAECLTMAENQKDVVLEVCNRTESRQKWQLENYNASVVMDM